LLLLPGPLQPSAHGPAAWLHTPCAVLAAVPAEKGALQTRARAVG
jgi:hypothetical protein